MDDLEEVERAQAFLADLQVGFEKWLPVDAIPALDVCRTQWWAAMRHFGVPDNEESRKIIWMTCVLAFLRIGDFAEQSREEAKDASLEETLTRFLLGFSSMSGVPEELKEMR